MLNENYAQYGCYDNKFCTLPISEINSVSEKVLGFYEKLPFNITSTPEMAASEIKSNNMLRHYFKSQESLFTPDSSVLEIGCGVGWMSNMINYYHNATVLGIDFNVKAVSFAKQVANILEGTADFLTANLFEYEGGPFDIVVSIGVLHHTGDCMAGIKKACDLTVKSGHVIIGLYNEFGRRPFLDYFDKLKKMGYSEEQLFNEYRKLDTRHKDQVLAKSWFYDQVLHPHETLHTLEQINEVFVNNGIKITGASFNDYNEFESLDELSKLEAALYNKGLSFIENGKYYSGLFIVIGQKA